jgi:FkbM family methyltransferase
MEWRDMPFVVDYLRRGDVFVDVGANIGVYSLLASTIPDVTILAFEPSSLAYQRLLENLRINGLNQVKAHNIALGSADRTGYLTTDKDTTNRIVDPENTNSRFIEPVTVRSLDSFFREYHVQKPSLIKIDVEGHELAVLEGAWETITAARPVLIIEQNRPGQLRKLLGTLGYRFYRYVPADRALVLTEERENDQNLIAIHHDTSACQRVASPEA